MITHFVTAEVDLQSSLADLQRAIESQLQIYGDPLRWAVTNVNTTAQTAIVEAIVTRNDER